MTKRKNPCGSERYYQLTGELTKKFSKYSRGQFKELVKEFTEKFYHGRNTILIQDLFQIPVNQHYPLKLMRLGRGGAWIAEYHVSALQYSVARKLVGELHCWSEMKNNFTSGRKTLGLT